VENNEEMNDQPSVAESQLPGKLLWETRTKRNLTLEQVADDLCLTPQQVEAMEKDDYGYLPGATYVRGYLRNYARLLGLPEDKVLSIESIPTTVKPSETSYKKAIVAEEATRSRSVAFLSFIIVAILLALIYGWWQSRETAEFRPFLGETAGHESADHESVEHEAANADAGSNAVSAPVASLSESQPVAAESADSAEAATPSSDDVIPPENGEASVRAEKTAAPEAEGASSEAAVSAVSNADGSNVVLVFSTDSWVDIKDASGKTLIRRTVKAGQTKQFSGTAPFKMFLGNARGVKVNYRGKDYDISSYINGAIARFTLK